MATPHYVYRMYDEDGRLLYVGISKTLATRLTQHHRDKPWAHEIASVTGKRYTSRDAARAAEIQAIGTEGPAYNVQDRDKKADAHRERQALWDSMTQEERHEAAQMLERWTSGDTFDWAKSDAQDRSIRGAMMSVAASLRRGDSVQSGLEAWYGARGRAS
jgi:predicted GIY-YIG superfamily endonuclease